MTPAQIDRMRALWEGSPELTAAVIGERFGVSKGTVIGHAHRRGWAPRRRGAYVPPDHALRDRWRSLIGPMKVALRREIERGTADVLAETGARR